jgi:hypothetical protein
VGNSPRNKESKGLAIRQSTRQIARAWKNRQARIYVHGRKGVERPGLLLLLHLYEHLEALFFCPTVIDCVRTAYVEPNETTWTDLLMLSQVQADREFLAMQKRGSAGFQVDKATIDKFFTETSRNASRDIQESMFSSGSEFGVKRLLCTHVLLCCCRCAHESRRNRL